MARRRKQSPLLIFIVVVVILIAAALGIDLPPEVRQLLPPEIAQLLPRSETPPPPPAQLPTPGDDPVLADLPTTAGSFETAKKRLYEDIYHDNRRTFYCGCTYSEDRQVDLGSCDMSALADVRRAGRIEAEHVFPAWQFGNFRQCWREPEQVCGEDISGRECCEKSDPVFEAAHNDLHNLYPAVGEVNGRRSNYNWGMIPGENRQFGACNIEVDTDNRRAEPPEQVMGDIARTMFYMSETYGFRLSDQDRQLYEAWHRQDPPDDWERERNRRIAALQGRGNRFVED